MSKQNKVILIIAVILIAVGLILMARESKAPQNNNGQTIKPVDQADHLLGDANAPVKIIIYSDFQCPFCAEFAQTLKRVEQEFKDKVVMVFRHYPLPGHQEAEPAAEASECAAEQGKFWQMHDKLFADNLAGRLSQEQYKQDAADLGLEQNKFNQCLDSGQYQDKIKQQKAEGAIAGVTGTPTFFINNYIYPGAYPLDDFTASDGRPEKGMKSIISELLK